jgi:hypothetical protein
MKHIRITCILLISGILFSTGIFIEAGGSELDDKEEEKYYQLLKEKSKEAAEHFRAAREAMGRNEFETAENNYRKVITLVPDFAPALRRLSYITVNDPEAVVEALGAAVARANPEKREEKSSYQAARPGIRRGNTSNFSNVFLKDLSAQLQDEKKKELKNFITRIITDAVMSNKK